jgi:hypothetical protein
MLEELLVRLRLLGDALDDDRHALLRLGQGKGLDLRRLGHPRNGIAVRARARHPQKLGQPVFDPGRERVLEAVRLLVRVGPVEAQRIREPALEEPVTPGHHLGDLTALR